MTAATGHRGGLGVGLAAALALGAGCAPAVVWTGRTADRRHRVEIVQDDRVQWVVVDGRRRAAYRGIAAWSIALDGARVVYAARRGARWVVVDGRAGPEVDGVGEIALGAGGRLAYAAERAGRWQVIVDGGAERAPGWTAILAHTLRFSRDGAHLVHAAEDAAGVHVVVDGVVGPAWSGVGQLAIDEAGAHVAYAARRGRDAYAVIDGAAGPRFDDVTQLTVAPRGGRVAYVGLAGGRSRVVIDGTLGPPLDGPVGALRISAGGGHVVYATTGRGDRVICDGDERGAAPAGAIDAGSLAFVAAAGCDVAYTVAEPGGVRVVAAGVPGPRYDEVGPLSVSRDGAHLGYAARRGATWCVVIDGREHDGGWAAEAPVFSPDGTRAGYLTRRGDRAVAVVDDRPHTFDTAIEGTLAFSSDGRTWSILAGDLAREELYFAIDGVHRVPLPAGELYSAAAALSLDHPLLDPTTPNVLGLWSAAEAERASADARVTAR